MVTHQGCPQTPGGRIRALGFARMGARGRRRGPIAGYVYTMLPSDAGRAHPRPWLRAHERAGPPSRPDSRIRIYHAALRRRAGTSAPPRVHTLGLRVHEDAGPRRRGPRTDDVSVSGLAGIR
jgi:hypothetical protein